MSARMREGICVSVRYMTPWLTSNTIACEVVRESISRRSVSGGGRCVLYQLIGGRDRTYVVTFCIEDLALGELSLPFVSRTEVMVRGSGVAHRRLPTVLG